jgi:hypothetical protein
MQIVTGTIRSIFGVYSSRMCSEDFSRFAILALEMADAFLDETLKESVVEIVFEASQQVFLIDSDLQKIKMELLDLTNETRAEPVRRRLLAAQDKSWGYRPADMSSVDRSELHQRRQEMNAKLSSLKERLEVQQNDLVRQWQLPFALEAMRSSATGLDLLLEAAHNGHTDRGESIRAPEIQ